MFIADSLVCSRPVVDQLLLDKSSTVTGVSLVELLRDLYRLWLLPVAANVGVTEVKLLQ